MTRVCVGQDNADGREWGAVPGSALWLGLFSALSGAYACLLA